MPPFKKGLSWSETIRASGGYTVGEKVFETSLSTPTTIENRSFNLPIMLYVRIS